MDQARGYSMSFLIKESYLEYEKAMKLAETNNLEEEYIEAQIALAELLRRSRDYDHGFRLLNSIKGYENFPKQHAKFYGRMAAYYNEMDLPEEMHQQDSVRFYIQKALPVAKDAGLELELASLNNELGAWYFRKNQFKIALKHLERAATLFWQNQDTANYVNSLTNVMTTYYEQRQTQKGDSICDYLLNLSSKKNWFSAKTIICYARSDHALDIGDSVQYEKWKAKALEYEVNHLRASRDMQMGKLLVLNETDRLVAQAQKAERIAKQKEEELLEEAKRRRELIVFLIVLVALMVGVGGLLYRENRLRVKLDNTIEQLNQANENYQMLMLESNHRIKNNLQMVVSMLQFASKDLKKSKEHALESISRKIHTISTLHQQLYLDVHNPQVKLKTYFQDILKSYLEIESENLELKVQLDDIEIASERIVYFGLILNELLSNTLEHHPDNTKKVELTVERFKKGYRFSYKDFSPRLKTEGGKMGMKLTNQLVKRIKGRNFILDEKYYHYQFEFDA